MKRLITCLVCIAGLFIQVPLMATHNRAGEITYTHLSGYTYELTITTFTYTLSAADRQQLEVQWGDNSTSIADRVSKVILPNFYYHNTYVTQHTFPGPGTYEIVVQDPNRNYGVRNIPNSVNVIFSVKTELVISPLTGANSAPVLLNPPIDKAAKGRLFIHNPGAYDKEGDSLSYELTVCTEANGKPITGYTYPTASDTFYVNPITGDLVWDTPTDTGIYNVAMKVNKWRNNMIVCSVARDMQINVYNTTNEPPVNPPLQDYCVVAGTLIDFTIKSTDPNGDKLYIRASGGPFEMDSGKATFDSITADTGYTIARFRWQTNCTHVRERPYQVTIKSTDINKEISLNDYDVFNIRVIGPPPSGLEASPSANFIRLTWDKYDCSSIKYFEIYRKDGSGNFTPDSCETGVPSYTGFVKIGQTSSGSDTSYIDNGNGNGLNQGIEYCYLIVAIYSDVPSVASQVVCSSLVPGIPALINASVTTMDADTGSVYLAWLKPHDLDTIPANGPYKLLIYRSPDLWGTNFSLIDSISTTTLDDTTYLDHPLNTIIFPYTYKVELYNDAPGDRRLIGRPEMASTIYPILTGGDNTVKISVGQNVPWINNSYTIYRLNSSTSVFDSIGTTSDQSYTDSSLTNGHKYCYCIKSHGYRDLKDLRIFNENLSHQNCAVAIDTTPPCKPVLNVTNACDSSYNLLTWTNPNNSCANDVVSYNIYYSPTYSGTPELTGSVGPAADTSWRHYPNGNLAGCYQVTAVDSFGNESPKSVTICVDACSSYELPNVFTPNGDGINDIYLAKNKNNYVQKVDMKIYNRWGQLIFHTTDPLIKWDGRSKESHSIVPSGVYYYVCDVYEPRLTGLEVRNLVGFIHVYSSSNGKTQSK